MTTFPIPPRQVSHYRLLEVLGRGAMGEVWLAEDTQLPRQAAVKLLPAFLNPGEAVSIPQPALAVMRFEVLSADPDDGYLAAGLCDDLIVDLARVEGLRVASRGDVAPYGERAVPPRTLARELGVDAVLLGSVRRHGNRTRISAQLVRATDGHVLWAGRFDRTLEDLFDVQAEVSREIVAALQVTLKPEEREMLHRAPTQNTEAYTLFLRARELSERSRDENLQAERLLQQALALDPRFALAHAALGECYARRGLRWWSGREVAEPAMQCARRALELEPGLPDAYRVELMVRRLQGEPEQVLQAIEKLLATMPGDGEAQEWAAWSYMALGKPTAALPILERLVEKRPDRVMGLSLLGNCYGMLEREGEAKRLDQIMRDRCIEILQRDPQAVHPRSLLAGALVRLGEVQAGIEQAERAVALAPNDGRIRYNAACAYAQTGRADDAFRHLSEALRNMPSYLADWSRHDPDLNTLRGHPEFVRLFGTT